MRRRALGMGTFAVGLALAFAGTAQADTETFQVDTTSDSGALTTCGIPAGDCSLRGAFANANDTDPVTDKDSITFDSTIFDGVETVPGEATIVLADNLVSDEPLELSANCAVTNPCVGIDGPNSAALNAIAVVDATFQMDDVAIFGTGAAGLFYATPGDALTLVGNTFGLMLNGNQAANDMGVFVAGPNADVGVIGQEGNVFAGNRVGLDLIGPSATNVNVHENLFGTRTNGSFAPNTGADIDIAGNINGEAPSDVRIGGNPNATQECDDGCNVIAGNGSGTGPRGIDLSGATTPGSTSTATDVEIEFNYIGVAESGTSSTGATGILVATGAADNVVVANNWMASGRIAVAAGPDGESVNIESNKIGTNFAGTGLVDGTTQSSIVVNSANVDLPITALNNTIGEEAAVIAIEILGTGSEAIGNTIGIPGVPNSGGDVAVSAGQATAAAIVGNVISNTSASAIQLIDTDDSLVEANEIGAGGPIDGVGILVTDSVLNATGNTIGGTEAGNANTFGQVGDDAIRIQNAGNDQHAIKVNLGGPVGSGTFIDLEGTNGPGNGGGPNAGIENPKVKKIAEKQISGTAEPGGKVWVYRACSISGVFPDCLSKFLGSKKVKNDGTWKLKQEQRQEELGHHREPGRRGRERLRADQGEEAEVVRRRAT